LEKQKTKSALKLLLKLGLSALAMWLVFSKISLGEIWLLVSRANLMYLLLAVLAFNISKFHSAGRLLKLFQALHIPLSSARNLTLYYVGMFYNLFLPGGIGGDGYKVYWLHKQYGTSRRKLLAAVLLDRIAGAAILVCIALALALLSDEIFQGLSGYIWWLTAAAAVLSIPSFLVVVKFLFPDFWTESVSLVLWSIRVQFTQVVCAWFILRAIGVYDHQILYFSLFLVSSLAAMLPISFGGVGLRELMFLYAAQYLPIDETASVSLGLIFFLITAVSSFAGVFIKLPEKATGQEEAATARV
jgi:uncharacterized membrane protein YbhN (UPF0104 family)